VTVQLAQQAPVAFGETGGQREANVVGRRGTSPGRRRASSPTESGFAARGGRPVPTCGFVPGTGLPRDFSPRARLTARLTGWLTERLSGGLSHAHAFRPWDRCLVCPHPSYGRAGGHSAEWTARFSLAGSGRSLRLVCPHPHCGRAVRRLSGPGIYFALMRLKMGAERIAVGLPSDC